MRAGVADRSQANLSQADLTDVNLSRADLYQVDLTGVTGWDTVTGEDPPKNLDKATGVPG